MPLVYSASRSEADARECGARSGFLEPPAERVGQIAVSGERVRLADAERGDAREIDGHAVITDRDVMGGRVANRVGGGGLFVKTIGVTDRGDESGTDGRAPRRSEPVAHRIEESRHEPRQISGAAHCSCGPQCIDARRGELVDHRDRLGARTVDFGDLTSQCGYECGIGEHDRDLIERGPVGAAQYFDAHDVALERSDSRSDESEGAGSVRDADANQCEATGHGSHHSDVTRDGGTRRLGPVRRIATVMRLGVYGGTFDPIHIAHLVVATEVRHALRLDQVLLVPAGDPWQKRGQVVATSGQRLRLVELAVAEIDGIDACAIEVDRSGPSVTADTLEGLAAPDRELFLILGADAAANMPTWRRLEDTRDLATVVVVERTGEHADPPGPGWRFLHVPIPRLDISSSEVRARLVDGRPVDGLVPPAVVRGIREDHLYTAES